MRGNKPNLSSQKGLPIIRQPLALAVETQIETALAGVEANEQGVHAIKVTDLAEQLLPQRAERRCAKNQKVRLLKQERSSHKSRIEVDGATDFPCDLDHCALDRVTDERNGRRTRAGLRVR